MNILLDLSFDGSGFCGFQVQKNGRSVCEAVQNALEAVLGERPDVKGCSRTDAGVHALHYALSFCAAPAVSLEKLPLALNQNLPPGHSGEQRAASAGGLSRPVRRPRQDLRVPHLEQPDRQPV